MSGVGEASLVLGIISSIISIIDATKQVYEAVEDEVGLPTNFKKSATKLPLISKLLEDAERYINTAADESVKAAFIPTLEDCKVQATQLQELFKKVMPEDGESRWDRYVKAARTIGKGGRVESLVGGVLDDLQLLATSFPEVMNSRGKEQLAKAVEEVTKMEPSLPDGFEQIPGYAHYGSGAQNINTGSGIQHINSGTGNQNSGSGQQYIGTNHIVNNPTVDDIDRSCLRSLRCPDTLAVKNRLKENKDKLLHKSIHWILQDPQYLSWKDGADIGLLWIKGGAGKGKTMMSIGLIERLSFPQDESTVMTYFFCQNADYELNTLEAIIKGLILQLVNQQRELNEPLRRHWDTMNERFDEDMTSWRTLWNIFLEMVSQCKCLRLYVIIDALDECRDDGMADLLKLIVRTGLDCPSRIKWLLTSRPLDGAERELLAGSDQVLVSLELNSKHVSEAVKTYIAFKMDELDRRCSYGETLRREIQTELAERAEDTYLWVSLVCKRLESVHRDQALTTIQDLPPGLPAFYNRMFNLLSSGESAVVEGCMRLLKVMMLAYRPLNIEEVGSVIGPSDKRVPFKVLVDRCASFIKMRDTNIEFVHQSARDYLAGKSGQPTIEFYDNYGHGQIALSCLSYLSQQLKANLVDLPRPDSTRELMRSNGLVASVDYASTFWARHLEGAKRTMLIQNALAKFLSTKLLEWLECLNGKQIASGSGDWTIKLWDASTGDVQKTLTGHSISVRAVVFSPDGKQIASGSGDQTIKLWDTSTGDVQKTLIGHSDWVGAVAFSPDGKQIASGSGDQTIKLWDTSTGNVQKTLRGHSRSVDAVAFSPDGKQIASGSWDGTIKLWDAAKAFEVPGIFGRVGRYVNFRAFQEINTLQKVDSLRFSSDGGHLATNLGLIKIKNTIHTKNPEFQSLKLLCVSKQWIFYGAEPVFLLPSDFKPACHDVRGDQLTIGFQNGRVLSFDINRRCLN